MRYEVPQFIEIEDKIVGPLTWKQFLYLAGGGGMCLVAYLTLPIVAAIPIMVPVAMLAFALAFYKVNRRPFVLFLESFFNYTTKKKLYIWKKRETSKNKPIEQEVEEIVGAQQPYVPKMSDSKLKDLSWALDIEHRKGEVL